MFSFSSCKLGESHAPSWNVFWFVQMAQASGHFLDHGCAGEMQCHLLQSISCLPLEDQGDIAWLSFGWISDFWDVGL